MQTRQPNDLTLCALAVVAFVIACVAHEAVGHGLVCLASGGNITLLTSVYFRCHPSVPAVDAAGPLMNLVVAAASAFFVGRFSDHPHARSFFAMLLAFSGLWSAGYFIYSAVANTGDPAFVLRDLSLEPRWLWRIGMGLAGVWLYRLILRRALTFSPHGRSLSLAYSAAAAVACISVLFYQGPVLAALKDAALESFVAPVGLLLIAGRKPASREQVAPVRRGIVAVSVVVTVLFWFTMGKGIYAA